MVVGLGRIGLGVHGYGCRFGRGGVERVVGVFGGSVEGGGLWFGG